MARAAVLVLCLIFALDLGWRLASGPVGGSDFALIDEPAHMLTAVLLLLALVAAGFRPSAAFVAAALVASVAIDLDHLPRYLGWDGLSAGVPRPYTHSLFTPVLLIVVGQLAGGGWREIGFGAAFGVTAHLLRDLGTGLGVPLVWPLSRTAVAVPYAVVATMLVLVACLVVLRGRMTPETTPSARKIAA
jgi:inner membrane protein